MSEFEFDTPVVQRPKCASPESGGWFSRYYSLPANLEAGEGWWMGTAMGQKERVDTQWLVDAKHSTVLWTLVHQNSALYGVGDRAIVSKSAGC